MHFGNCDEMEVESSLTNVPVGLSCGKGNKRGQLSSKHPRASGSKRPLGPRPGPRRQRYDGCDTEGLLLCAGGGDPSVSCSKAFRVQLEKYRQEESPVSGHKLVFLVFLYISE